VQTLVKWLNIYQIISEKTLNRNIFVILFFLIFISLLNAQQNFNVLIKVIVHSRTDTAKIYIAGSTDNLGNWDPAVIPMIKSDSTTWEKAFKFPAGEVIEFKITRGSWANERLNDDETIPANTVLKVENDTTITLVINKWADQYKRKIVTHGKITGTVEYIRRLKGEGILPRDATIWLPSGYAKSKKERYPVLYMQDGQNIIDPATSSFGYDWRIDEVADSLIKANKIKKIIIVGIYNTSDRGLEYGGSKSDAYMKFIVNKLKPLIDKKYRTKPGRKNTALAGSSLGGTISFMLLWNYSDIFSAAACISPAFHYKEYDCLKLAEKKVKNKNLKIYIDIGGVGLDTLLQSGVNDMLALLKTKGYKEGINLDYFRDPAAEHSEQFWAKRDWRILEFFFGK
jgi:predicted alpha/beta superfamily hydrolase